MEPNDSLKDPISQVIAYHERTKHHFHRYALGPGHLDWATQPDPFWRYRGDPLLSLDHIAPSESPLYDEAFTDHRIPPVLLNRRSISQLFYDSLALSAWKQAGTARWALRVNPSSGNLHPTEGYLLCGAIPGLSNNPFLAHYAPKEHALEIHAHIPPRYGSTFCLDCWASRCWWGFPPSTGARPGNMVNAPIATAIT